jgi:hypothetical protein
MNAEEAVRGRHEHHPARAGARGGAHADHAASVARNCHGAHAPRGAADVVTAGRGVKKNAYGESGTRKAGVRARGHVKAHGEVVGGGRHVKGQPTSKDARPRVQRRGGEEAGAVRHGEERQWRRVEGLAGDGKHQRGTKRRSYVERAGHRGARHRARPAVEGGGCRRVGNDHVGSASCAARAAQRDAAGDGHRAVAARAAVCGARLPERVQSGRGPHRARAVGAHNGVRSDARNPAGAAAARAAVALRRGKRGGRAAAAAQPACAATAAKGEGGRGGVRNPAFRPADAAVARAGGKVRVAARARGEPILPIARGAVGASESAYLGGRGPPATAHGALHPPRRVAAGATAVRPRAGVAAVA